MTLFFDYNICVDPNSVHSHVKWHPQHGLIAISSFSEQSGGSVIICNDLGEALQGINNAQDKESIVTSLAWHPNQRLLVSGWDSGQLKVWNNDDDFISLPSTHSSPVLVLEFSQFGSRMITVDAVGLIVVWKFDGTGFPVKSFESQIKGSGTQAEFCHNHQSHYDVGHLAKMAVAGDETALDMFSSWRPKTAVKPVVPHLDNASVFVASDAGKVLFISEDGVSKEVLEINSGVRRLLHHERRDALVVCSDDGIFSYYSIDLDGSLTEISQVKLNNVSSDCSAIWAGPGLLACTSLDFSIRFWNVDSDDNYSLSVQELANNANLSKQMFTSIAYLPHKGLLCGATNMGNIIFWRFLSKVDSLTANSWEEVTNCRVKSCAKMCCWGASHLAVSTLNMVYILKEHQLLVFYNQKFSGIQISASQVLLKQNPTKEFAELSTDLKIKGLAIGDEFIVVWSNKTVAVYQSSIITEINVIGTFPCEVDSAFVKGQDLIVLNTANKILIYTFQGTIKANIECSSQPIGIDLNGDFLVVSTITGLLYIWDLSRREPKMRCKPKDLAENISDFGEIMSAKSNVNGSLVSITIAKANLLPAPKLFIYLVDSDSVLSHDFNENSNNCDQTESPARYIISHHWDCNEPKLLVCETKQPKNLPPETKSWSKKISGPLPTFPVPKLHKNSTTYSHVLINIFVSLEYGIVVQEQVNMSETFISLLAVDSPNYIVLLKPSASKKVKIENFLMKDFTGCGNCSEETRKAILDFGFYLCVNDMDNAFKSLATVKSVAVWTSLARMCIKLQRLDVAKVCLGNMHDARGVLMLRSAEKEPEVQAKIAALAIHLGMIEEAELLYRKCGRYDLLNILYRSSNQWDKALKVAEGKDRIHLRNTYHNYAKTLELKNDLNGATQMYQKAQTHRAQIPRMLLDDPLALEHYILQSKDPTLIRWWAQYVESTGDMNLAMKYYEEAKDYYAMVRIFCFMENFDKAAEIANKTSNKAACYHLAGQYENMGQIQEAVHFFTRATAFGNAIRLCKDQALDENLWNLALIAGNREKVEAARYLEKGNPEKAILLYQKAGLFHRAFDLAFKNQNFNVIQSITEELNVDSDIESILKCAKFLLEKKQYEKAVSLLGLAKHFDDAIRICFEKQVPVTDELAERLTPHADHPDRLRYLELLGECAVMQGNYHVATKKFTQAGNKIKAMKALLKSGDTDKVIFFANVSRQPELYIMAANYLQTLDWQTKPDLLKNIITFYTKGKAHNLLANFYVACAQVEIDEYGNYEKALGALTEASRLLIKDKEKYSHVIDSVAIKISQVKKFIDIKRTLERGESEEGLKQCKSLLSARSDLVRSGDIYSIMIEYAAKKNDWRTALHLAQELRKSLPNDNLSFYIPKDILVQLGMQSEQPATEALPDDTIEEDLPQLAAV